MQGVRATHPVDGDVSAYVEACASGFRFSEVGLEMCALNTSIVGRQEVTFRLVDVVSDTSVQATRTVVVHPVCSSDEVLCSTLVCSSSDVCISGEPLVTTPANSAPRLKLADGDLSVKYVGRGVEYATCESDEAHSSCAAAPSAFDPEDGSLSDDVLACPPDECMDFRCPGHTFRSKGVGLPSCANMHESGSTRHRRANAITAGGTEMPCSSNQVQVEIEA